MQFESLPKEHRQTYTGFMKASAAVTAFVVVLLAGMAFFLL